jgi:hypothetical protein
MNVIWVVVFILVLILLIFVSWNFTEINIRGGAEIKGPLIMRGDNVYNVRKLWKLTKKLPVIKIKTNDLKWNLE